MMEVAKIKLHLRLLFHLTANVCHWWTLIELYNIDFERMKHSRHYHLLSYQAFFFSGWNYAFQIFFLMLALCCDLVKLSVLLDGKIWVSYDIMKKLAFVRDFVFSTYVVPYTLFVTIAFWITFSTNRDLVMPKEWDKVFTPTINHAIHTFIMPVMILELLIVNKEHPQSHKSRLQALTVVTLFYYCCFLGIYFVKGTWIYELFSLFNWTERFLILAGFYVSAVSFYYLGWGINYLGVKIWNHYENKEIAKTKEKLY